MTFNPTPFRCTLCGRPQGKDRKVCSRCYKDGKSLRGGHCPDCGVEHGVGNRTRVYCDACRDVRLAERGKEYRARRKMSGIIRYRQMKQAETPLKHDKYAQYTPVPTDEEIAVKREKYRALLAADVHCGTYGRPSHRSYAVARDEAEGGFGALAFQHMRGGEAGHGMDREHTLRAQQNRESRARRDA
jgi:hypothetical protein